MKTGWVSAGAIAWSASEYLIHRFIGHGPKRTRATSALGLVTPGGLAAEFNAEHLAHHANPMYFTPTPRKVAMALAAVPMVGAALSPVLGIRRAASFAVGFAGMYATYEVLHRRIHTHGPTGPFSRWARRHHLLHHHRSPRHNHGVTSPLFDVVLGTRRPLEKLRVPRAVAPAWMVDPETGEVRAEHADDYVIWSSGRSASKDRRPAEEPVVVDAAD